MLRNTFPRLWILWITHAILWITYRLSTISTCVGSRPGPTSASTTRGWIPPFLEISLVALTISSCADRPFRQPAVRLCPATAASIRIVWSSARPHGRSPRKRMPDRDGISVEIDGILSPALPATVRTADGFDYGVGSGAHYRDIVQSHFVNALMKPFDTRSIGSTKVNWWSGRQRPPRYRGILHHCRYPPPS